MSVNVTITFYDELCTILIPTLSISLPVLYHLDPGNYHVVSVCYDPASVSGEC